jgi:hypothetical protein
MIGRVGPRGFGVLLLAGLIGLALAIVGWSQRGTGLVAPSMGGLGGSTPARTAAPAGTSASPPASATEPSAQASSAPPASPSTQPSAAASPSATPSLGPLLSSEPYAQFAFLVWPGNPSPTAQQAMSGLVVSVTRQAGGIAVRAGVAGQPLAAAHFYAEGGKVYILESNLGDDGSNLDYNLGDDGLIVTNPQGRIVP